jgi:hypothetical protein
MTTATWSSVLDHSSDAGFRAWGSELAAKLAAVGLVQTADTGQINWSTVTRPGTNTAGGYEIWRFADSSLYLKLEYGTGASAAVPLMWVTVGTGSNGSGTLTGQTSTRGQVGYGSAPGSTSTNYSSYMCHTADAFSLQWKHLSVGSNTTPSAILAIGKTVNSAGAATTTGFGVLRTASSQSYLQSVRTAAPAVTYTEQSQSWIAIPGLPTSSLLSDGATYQCYQSFLNVPDVQPFAWAHANVVVEIPRVTSYSLAMVGAASHTYLATGAGVSPSGLGSASTYGFGLIYE